MNKVFIKQAMSSILFLSVICTGHAQNKSTPKNPNVTTENVTYMNRESNEDSGESQMKFKKGNDTYSIKMLNDRVTHLSINGKDVPQESMHLYTTLIDSVKEQLKKDRAQAEEDRKQAALDRVQAQKDRAQAQMDRAQAQKDRENARQDRKNFEKEREQMSQHREQATRDRAQAERDRQQAVKDRAQAERDRAQAVKDRAQAEIDRKHAEEDRALIKDMLETAVKDGLISDVDAITKLELSAQGFWINDKKQTDAIHGKYKAAYLTKLGSKFTFSRNDSGSTYNQ